MHSVVGRIPDGLHRALLQHKLDTGTNIITMIEVALYDYAEKHQLRIKREWHNPRDFAIIEAPH